jgi:hypothetical protein
MAAIAPATDTKPWFRNDLARILLGINIASRSTAHGGEFRRGYILALLAMASSLGIPPQNILSPDDMTDAGVQNS